MPRGKRYDEATIRPIIERIAAAPHAAAAAKEAGLAWSVYSRWRRRLGVKSRRAPGPPPPARKAPAPRSPTSDQVTKLRARLADLELENTVLRTNLSLAVKRGFLNLFSGDDK